MKIEFDYRFGVLVPPANPTCEIEYPLLKPSRTVMHTMRLPVLPGDLESRNANYINSYDEAIKGFGNLNLEAIVIGLTGPQYRLGLKGDKDLCNRLSDKYGIKIETASLAIYKTLKKLGVERISMVSPYPNWLTEHAKNFWLGAGFEVKDIYSFKDELTAYDVTPKEVQSALESVNVSDSEAIVLSGTGMLTVEAILAAGKKVTTPMLSSNICSMYSIFDDYDLEKNNLIKKLFKI